MRDTITRRNEFGGKDFFYRIQCDECGSFLMKPKMRNKQQEVMEFRTCGEDELVAALREWVVSDGKHICPTCNKKLLFK